MRRSCMWANVLLVIALCFAATAPLQAQIRTWRVGETEHPWNIVPVTGRLEWGRGWACELVGDDEKPFADGIPIPGATVWLSPIRLDETRNLAVELNHRFLRGEFGGLTPGQAPRSLSMSVPSEYGYRFEPCDPIHGERWSPTPGFQRPDYVLMFDGDPLTALNSGLGPNWGPAANLMGYYYITAFGFGPRPTLPSATFSEYIVYFGNHTNIIGDRIVAPRVLVPQRRGEMNPAQKHFDFDPPVLAGRIDVNCLVPRLGLPGGKRVEVAQTFIHGDGFPIDARYISEIIDVGTPTPRVRRYSRNIELFGAADRHLFEQEFPDLPGREANWGRLRWRGRRLGDPADPADVRIQFRVGNSLDTHLYARRLGPGLVDHRDKEGNPLNLFSWIRLIEDRVHEKDLRFNELGFDLGPDGSRGWSHWSQPFKFDEGLIPEDLPPEQWSIVGVPLPLPGNTRYLQFRILFDSKQHSSVMFDFLEFEYAPPLVSGGLQAEIYPTAASLGVDTPFTYFFRPSFAAQETTQFNRLELEVPSIHARIDSLKFDGQSWTKIAPDIGTADPLLEVDPQLDGSRGQFAWTLVQDPRTDSAKLLVKLPLLDSSLFRFDEMFEIFFTTQLFRGSHEFTGVVWNDRTSERDAIIPQPIVGGDVTPEVASNGLIVVADRIGKTVQISRVAPNPFTPNDDGVNDKVIFTINLFLVLDKVGIELQIFDLSGRMVHQEQREQSAGQVVIEWDGRNAGGELMTPGLYLYRLQLDTDATTREQTGILSLVY